MALSDALHHGDYVIEQLMMGLRSAYRPDPGGKPSVYGFMLEDNGSGAQVSDVISWVKIGSALVGKGEDFAGSPHRVKFSVEPNEEGNSAVAVRAWGLVAQPEDFDADDVEPTFLATMITGFDCRVADKIEYDEIVWEDYWEDTNKVPSYLEVTLYMEALAEGEDAIEIKRIVMVPVVTQEGM